MQDNRISFEVAVILICFNSCLVPRDSETTILVPSDLTTLSRGDMRNAKGSLQRSVLAMDSIKVVVVGNSSLRQTLDDDKSDVSVGGDTSFHTLDMILCQA